MTPLAAGAINAVLLLTSIDAGLNAYSAINSSPQTTELFAGERKNTLMKYVYVADASVLALGIFSSWIAKNWWPLLGAILVVLLMHSLYVYAASCAS